MSDGTLNSSRVSLGVPVPRDEIVRQEAEAKQFSVVEKPLSGFEKLYNQGWLRKLFILLVLAFNVFNDALKDGWIDVDEQDRMRRHGLALRELGERVVVSADASAGRN